MSPCRDPRARKEPWPWPPTPSSGSLWRFLQRDRCSELRVPIGHLFRVGVVTFEDLVLPLSGLLGKRLGRLHLVLEHFFLGLCCGLLDLKLLDSFLE